ncbi:hypothetical protein PN480_00345 [Dolichospermum circinale CS-1225]|uniref:Uncharacterized protein n=1 Tax=Dolichospermum circinale CS-537/01 TaxID=3021739 RepID=A0ABT5A9J0_9CYAN|nr:hypothetical protein [Dolichospermum circinale]MDB9459194.1 hypothetical protein [Dolichospermum circinale CS-545/17]MDB9468344.1 hypothetical protein [Dolichospermum circinale CS-539/09]MDB9471935.1 hypothetical protein [Dolichospermum circinale CS-539]MDB9488628.1 hypothetical protein [Dolichospermum circinale CS-537/01]MDB9520403.1 hypothetical protein [Dolichospermum circinale CS-1225]
MQEKELKWVKTLALKLNKIYKKAQEQETAPEKISATAAIKKPTCAGFQWKVSKGG